MEKDITNLLHIIMTYDEWRDKTCAQVIAEELGYDHADEVPPHLMAEVQHKLAAIWIEYRMNNK